MNIEPIVQRNCLFYSGAVETYQSAHFGAGVDPIWLDDLNCPEDAANLNACSGWSWGTHNCGHGEDASVRCNDIDLNQAGSEGRKYIIHY